MQCTSDAAHNELYGRRGGRQLLPQLRLFFFFSFFRLMMAAIMMRLATECELQVSLKKCFNATRSYFILLFFSLSAYYYYY